MTNGLQGAAGGLWRRWCIAGAVTMAVLLAACTTAPTTKPGSTTTPALTRPAAPVGELSATLVAKLQAALDQTMTEYGVPGAAVGVWIRDQGAWTRAAGRADIATPASRTVPASTDMTWPLRSITKSYTVTLVLQLVDEGKIKLDDPIGRYVDGITHGDTITLRQLADMSSGNADYTNEDFLEAFTADPGRIFTLDELNGYVLGRPAQFAPGEKKIYTNSNTNLLGAVVEKVTGRGFAEVLQERILRPLGQQHTSYVLDADSWPKPHPIGYAPGTRRGRAAPRPSPPTFRSSVRPAP